MAPSPASRMRRLHLRNDLTHVSPCNTCTEWAWWKPSPFRSHGNYNATKLQGDKE